MKKILIIGSIFIMLIVIVIIGMYILNKNESREKSEMNNEENIESLVVKENANYSKEYFVEDITLNSGYKMPTLGFGTWTLYDEEAENCVYTALKDGYRLIDTAQYYGNEESVGNGIKRAIDDGIVKREDIFITSKIMPSSYSNADKSIDESLQRLDVEYIDLMLIHQPGSNDEEVYNALERGVKNNKIHSIGISNYYTAEDFEKIIKDAEIKPAVVQNENHIYYQNTELQEYVKRYGTVIESWYPFGGRGHTSENFNNETIKKLAEKYNKTSAQIILRWQLQAGYIAIPGSSNPSHIAENYNIFDFKLSDEDMKEISNINKNQRYENW